MATKPKTRVTQRIGPHSLNILSVLIGSILGDTFAEKHGEGTRICFQQEHSNNAYFLWFNSSRPRFATKAGVLVANLGYCNPLTPKILTRLGKKGKVRQLSLAEGYKTFTYASFNWIEEVACVVASSLRLQRPLLRE